MCWPDLLLPAEERDNTMANMRLYAPKAQALDGLWNPPSIKKVL